MALRRQTEFPSEMASAAVCMEAERDNLTVSEIKGEKPEACLIGSVLPHA